VHTSTVHCEPVLFPFLRGSKQGEYIVPVYEYTVNSSFSLYHREQGKWVHSTHIRTHCDPILFPFLRGSEQSEYTVLINEYTVLPHII
jgi:preprotein translocase subunit SecB